jgi:hypothetical protein
MLDATKEKEILFLIKTFYYTPLERDENKNEQQESTLKRSQVFHFLSTISLPSSSSTKS